MHRHSPHLYVLLFLCGLATVLPVKTSAEPAPAAVVVDGTQFRVAMANGRVLRSPELVGAVLTVALGGSMVRMRIDAVETDPGDPGRATQPSPAVFLHTLSVQSADGSWANICEPGPDGRREAFPIAGRALPDGTIAKAEPGVFALTCTGGAEGKCVRFGYHPWESHPDGAPMLPVYNACVHLVRADYAGDGSATTRNGQPIDIYDVFGIQTPAGVSGYEFEAGFTADGATCVRHVRVKENADLAGLATATPRLAGETGTVCTEAHARSQGAILLVRSPP